MATDPALSTQIFTGLLRQACAALAIQMRGPTSSRAESFFLSCFPSAARMLLLIFRPQGTMNQKLGPTPPVPCPIDIMDPSGGVGVKVECPKEAGCMFVGLGMET